jgi:hypothetical protein
MAGGSGMKNLGCSPNLDDGYPSSLLRVLDVG